MRLVVEFGLGLVVLSGLECVCVCGVRCFWAALFVLCFNGGAAGGQNAEERGGFSLTYSHIT